MVAAFLHLIGGVLLAGYALFWVVMARGLEREGEPPESSGLLRVINRGRWPPAGAPTALRMPMPVLGWLFLVVLAVTGVLMLAAEGVILDAPPAGGAAAEGTVRLGRAASGVLNWKLALFGVLLAGQALATVRPARWIASLNGVLVLAIVVLSAWLGH